MCQYPWKMVARYADGEEIEIGGKSEEDSVKVPRIRDGPKRAQKGNPEKGENFEATGNVMG